MYKYITFRFNMDKTDDRKLWQYISEHRGTATQKAFIRRLVMEHVRHLETLDILNLPDPDKEEDPDEFLT